MQDMPRYTVTYCQYQDSKNETDRPMEQLRKSYFLPMCKNGDSCHISAPRGSATGTQGLKNARERSKIPKKLCEHIFNLCHKKDRQ